MKCASCGDEVAGRIWRDVPDFEYGTYHPVDFIACQRCGMIAQTPLPDAAFIPSFYPSDYRNHLIAEGRLPAGRQGFFSVLKRIQTRRIARRIGRHLTSRGAKVLEVGCGSGALLMAFRELGFQNLFGSDFEAAAATPLAAAGIRFRRSDIERGFPFTERFDAVIMVNIIEHLLDPTGVLRRIREHLAPDGKVIIITPNAGAIELSIFGRYWSGFHAPRHLWLFSRDGFKHTARKLGLGVSLRPVSDPGQWAISLQNLFQESRFLRSRLTSGLAWYTPILAVLFSPLAWLQNFLTRRSAAMLAIFSTEA